MILGVVKEAAASECRVALVPTAISSLLKAGFSVTIEAGAGVPAGYLDDAYRAVGATVVDRKTALEADVVAVVRYLGADPDNADALAKSMRPGQIWIGHADPLSRPDLVQAAAATKATLTAMELVPRITRAQSMDALSSQANLAGYKSVLLGAEALDKVLPMMTTAAGTIPPAKVMILGVGVAGLQAIATARRLGAVVSAYDVRPETKTQVESLGARFVELDLKAEQGEGGYAKAQSEDFIRSQQELLGDALAEIDIVITTAAVPGRKAPILVTLAMLAKMRPGSVLVDIAAERGGNCEATRPGETVVVNGVRILGPVNIPGTIAFHASAMYAKNVANYLLNLVKDKTLAPNPEDPIVAESFLTRDGEVVNSRVREALV